eukprot:4962896-Alexandrium_andersonii.AAC.1
MCVALRCLSIIFMSSCNWRKMPRSAREWSLARPEPTPVPEAARPSRLPGRRSVMTSALDHPLRRAAKTDTIGFAAS